MERTVQLDLRLKLNAMRDSLGYVESVNAELFWDGMAFEIDDRLVNLSLKLPVSLWEAPHIDVEVKSILQQMLGEIKGVELDVQR